MANSTTPSNTLKKRLSTMLSSPFGETVKDLPRVVKEVATTAYSQYDIGSKGSFEGGQTDATKKQKNPSWYKENRTLDKQYASLGRRAMRSKTIRGLLPDAWQRGYDDTVSNVSYDVEPINMEVVAMIEGGKGMQTKLKKGIDVSNMSITNPNAKGRFQIIPGMHDKDDKRLKKYGYKPYTDMLAAGEDFRNLTDNQQREHANRYLKSLIGKYSDRFSGTQTWKYRDYDQTTNKFSMVEGTDAKGHWGGVDDDVYTPADAWRNGARAAALVAYNLGHNDLDKILDDPNLRLTDAGNSVVSKKKMEEVRGYLGRYVAEGELTAQEIVQAFPEMSGHIEKYAKDWHEQQGGRFRY